MSQGPQREYELVIEPYIKWQDTFEEEEIRREVAELKEKWERFKQDEKEK